MPHSRATCSTCASDATSSQEQARSQRLNSLARAHTVHGVGGVSRLADDIANFTSLRERLQHLAAEEGMTRNAAGDLEHGSMQHSHAHDSEGDGERQPLLS